MENKFMFLKRLYLRFQLNIFNLYKFKILSYGFVSWTRIGLKGNEACVGFVWIGTGSCELSNACELPLLSCIKRGLKRQKYLVSDSMPHIQLSTAHYNMLLF